MRCKKSYTFHMRRAWRFLKAVLKLLKKSSWGPFTEIAEITGFDHAVTVSWSQGGEDLALLSALNGQRDGSYIDIGAHHPSRFSVTRHLYQLGWSGVNVDANNKLIGDFNHQRKRDVNLCAAVGLENRYVFTIFEEPAISTLDIDWRDKFIGEKNKVAQIVEVQGRSLRGILDEFYASERLDLLSIDAEGSDLQVLQSLEFNTLEQSRFPRWLLLEATPPVSDALETPAVKLAMEWGYQPHMVLAMSTLLKLHR
jgi:FkbM family methyltransferase